VRRRGQISKSNRFVTGDHRSMVTAGTA
jgi:hypothetical protein